MILKMGSLLLVFTAVFGNAHPAASQEIKEAQYFCVVEMAGGLSYFKDRKKWGGTIFQPEGKFVLHVSRVETRKEGALGVQTYTMNLTDAGQENKSPCYSISGTLNELVEVHTTRYMLCDRSLTQYRFNLITNRFTAFYYPGFINGQDNDDNTPVVKGGTCTKI